MNNAQLVTMLNNLIQADIDAYYIAHKGLDNVEDDDIINYLSQLQKNHEQRANDLSGMVRYLGGDPPLTQDLKGYALEGIVALSGLFEQKRVLQRVHSAEEKISAFYKELKDLMDKEKPVVGEIRDLLEKYSTDQQQYLESIEQLLKAA